MPKKKKAKKRAKKPKPDKVKTRPRLKEKSIKKPGKPKRIFTDKEKASINQMALDNCHLDTIALALNIPKQTLVDNFRTFIVQKRAEGRTLLRRAQREKALVGRDTGMLCFLGKNELEQTDKRELQHTGADGKPLEPIQVIIKQGLKS